MRQNQRCCRLWWLSGNNDTIGSARGRKGGRGRGTCEPPLRGLARAHSTILKHNTSKYMVLSSVLLSLLGDAGPSAPAPAGAIPSRANVPSRPVLPRLPMASDGKAVRPPAGFLVADAPLPPPAACGARRAGANVDEKRACDTGAGRVAARGAVWIDARIARCILTSLLIAPERVGLARSDQTPAQARPTAPALFVRRLSRMNAQPRSQSPERRRLLPLPPELSGKKSSRM